MIPQELMEHTEQALRYRQRTCLTCIHYRMREHAQWLVCGVRPRTMELAAAFDDERAEMALRRAGKCRRWEPDDGD